MNTIDIRYEFTFADDTTEVFELHLDARSLQLRGMNPKKKPEWTQLGFYQCPGCSLSEKVHSNCPVSVNLISLVERFERFISYDRVHVVVHTVERTVSHDTTAQKGISSLMGLVIAASECPKTDFFKPMARFHLPFASEEETIWRAVSTYLLAQYFLTQEGHSFDIELQGLAKIYDDIEKLNISMANRLRAASKYDSAVNAIIHLDVFAKYLTPAIEESLGKLRPIFEPFLRHYTGRP